MRKFGRSAALAAACAVVAVPAGLALATPEASAQQGRFGRTNGYNVSRAEHPQGHFEQTGPRSWGEYDIRGRQTFRFIEENRDEWSVYLRDPSRNVRIQIDIHRAWIRYADGGGPYSDLYRITNASPRADGGNRGGGWDRGGDGGGWGGPDIDRVDYNGGWFEQTGRDRWTEYATGGRVKAQFFETGRGPGEIRLNDPSRNLQITLDLPRRVIRIGERGGPQRFLYGITSTTPSRGGRGGGWDRGGGGWDRGGGRGPETRNVEAGPIWNQADAERKCRDLAQREGGEWTGQWRTTQFGRMSVCEIRFGGRGGWRR